MALAVEQAARIFTGLQGKDLLAATLDGFRGRVALVSSFGAESAVLLHMAAQIDRDVPVIFVDTGKLFWQTRYYRAKLVDQLGLRDIRIVRPLAGDIARNDNDGMLYQRDVDDCCHIRKTMPLQRTLESFSAWVSGRKRYHGAERDDLQAANVTDGRLKIEPLAEMDHQAISTYMAEHDLPAHPLIARGYFSIGCEPCTTKGGSPDNPRAGRWAGSEKSECGIHWDANGRPQRVDCDEKSG